MLTQILINKIWFSYLIYFFKISRRGLNIYFLILGQLEFKDFLIAYCIINFIYVLTGALKLRREETPGKKSQDELGRLSKVSCLTAFPFVRQLCLFLLQRAETMFFVVKFKHLSS